MFSSNRKVSVRQMQINLIVIIFSGISLVIPRLVTEAGNQNGWMLLIGATLIMILYSTLLASLGQMFPDKTIVEYAGDILTKPVGFIISLGLLSEFIIYAAFQLRKFGELVKQTLLLRTPIEIIMITMLLISAFLTRKGYEAHTRLCEIILFLALIPVYFVLIFAVGEIKISNLAPFFSLSAKELIFGNIWLSLIIASGLEILYVNISLCRKPKNLVKPLAQGMIFIGILVTVVSIVTIGIFGANETKRQIWPVMKIMQVVNLPGSFIERQDALMASYWILMVFVLISTYLHNASILTSQLVRGKESNYISLILLPLIYVVSLIPNNVPITFRYLKAITAIYSLIYLVIVPTILIVVAKLRKLGVTNESKT